MQMLHYRPYKVDKLIVNVPIELAGTNSCLAGTYTLLIIALLNGLFHVCIWRGSFIVLFQHFSVMSMLTFCRNSTCECDEGSGREVETAEGGICQRVGIATADERLECSIRRRIGRWSSNRRDACSVCRFV